MKKLRILAICACFAICAGADENGHPNKVRTFSAATVTETEIELPTYQFFDSDPVPATGESRYPYFFFHGTNEKSVSRKWKAVILENNRIKMTILPEIGGKVWGAQDKVTGHDFIYFNHAVKFRNIAMRGPWCSGGIEFNFGIIGHAPTSATPVDWCVRTNADGSASYFCSSTELICRTTWQVEVNLPADADYFLTRTIWFNGSNLAVPYYQWMNAAYSARGNPEFFFPGSSYIGHGGDPHPWPVDDQGHTLSNYSENAFGSHKSYHVLNGDHTVYGVWWPDKKIGSIHENGVTQKYGRKVWLWALSREGGIWEDLLTDTDGQYTELQSGRCFNQPGDTLKTPFKHPAFEPGATDTFEEKWGVVRDRADLAKRLNVTNTVPRPLAMPDGFNWDSAYGHYVKGEQALFQRKDAEAKEELLKSLEIEPCFAPALDKLAALSVRRGDYAGAHGYAQRALAVNTYDPEANFADGQAFFAEGDLLTAKERLGLAAYSPQVRASAFVLVAKAEMREGHWDEAAKMAQDALVANGLNLDAWLVRIAAARKRGDKVAAADTARRILDRVPLFHAARYELNLVDAATEPFAKFVRGEFPYQTYIDLGGWYEEAGLYDDAERFFRLAAVNPVGGLRLAYLLYRTGRGGETKKTLDAVAAAPIDFALPFRRETLPALDHAAMNHPSWKFSYYAAVGFAANGWGERSDKLLEKCGDKPDDETFYLFRASREKGDRRLCDLRRAAKFQRSWRVGYALYRHFAETGDWESALAEITPCFDRYPESNPVKLAYATALSQSGRFQETVDYLEKTTFLPSECGDNALPAWVNAWRGIALDALKRGDRNAAKAAVKKAVSYPENLGCGKPYDSQENGVAVPPKIIKDWPEQLLELAK